MTIPRYRLGVDIGGTFTDFTLVDDASGRIVVEKCLTTPGRPEEGVMNGVEALTAGGTRTLADASAVMHATTLFTNVILERKGARTGLLTTAGFRDVLEIGRELRYDIYDPHIRFPAPLVDRPYRLGIRERMLVDGTVRETLDEADVRAAAATFRAAGVASVAVCFLHSYRNDAHERRAREILREEMPGVEVSLSCDVHPEPKEFERTSTTVLNAYVQPIAASYLDRLSDGLARYDYARTLFVMLSNGGAATAETTKRLPVQAIESGPAAGVEAAMHYGNLLGETRLLSFDMGGTTAKLCVVRDGKAARTRSFEVDRTSRFRSGSGIPSAVPVYDLLEIGAGGGSIARVNDLGLLQVGPDSAGAMPGPACYGRGGEQPTITDADVVLGHLDPGFFLGGAMALDRAAAERALESKVAGPLGMSAVEAARGVFNVVNETMASAARVHVAEKGLSPRDLTLVAFGGAGPVHAVDLARKLGCPKVIVPPRPGVMSSVGLLTAPIAIERPRTQRIRWDAVDPARMEAESKALEVEVAAHLPDPKQARFERVVDMWYVGQDYPLEVALDGPWTAPGALERLRDAFYAEYKRLYDRYDSDSPLEIVVLRVRGYQTSPPLENRVAVSDGTPLKGRRPVHISAEKGFVDTPVYDRGALAPGFAATGPAIVEERESTTVIGDGDRFAVDRFGCLVIELAGS